jgi:hypothetical protein
MALFYGETRALNEIESVLRAQWSNGMLPQIRFVPGQEGYSPGPEEWAVPQKVSGNSFFQTSGITQPPNTAMALWQVFKNSGHRPEMVHFVEKFYRPLRLYHDFLLTKRDPLGEGLASVFHPWATGSDNTPCYDKAIEAARKELAEKGFEQRIKKRKDMLYVAAGQRPKNKDYEAYGRLLGFFVSKNYDQEALYRECPFLVQDVLFNCILKESLTAMSKLAEALALHFHNIDPKTATYYLEEVERNSRLALKVRNGVRKKLFDKGTGLFYSFDVRNSELIKVPTVHSLAGLFGKVASREQAEDLIGHLKSGEEFSPKEGFMVPSVPLNSPEFNSIGYARGPIWPVRNWIVAKGLQHYDRALAEKVRQHTLELVGQGHREMKRLESLAAALMEFNSFGEQFTTPSKKQYCHGWLWDSGFAAIGWSHVKKRPNAGIWERISRKQREFEETGLGKAEAKAAVRQEFAIPLFDEYFAPLKANGFEAGAALGADKMTWTAALFLDLLAPKTF